MSNRLYDILKWLMFVAFPAFSALVFTIGQIWGFPTERIIGTVAALQTFLGVMLGISNHNYKKELSENDQMVHDDCDKTE